jgi:uncharacterized protein
MTGVLPAFLFEAVFFLAAGFEEARRFLSRLSRPVLSLVMLVSAITPYLLVSLPAGTFESHSFFVLLGLCTVISFWYTVLPQRPAYDIGLLVILAAVMVLRIFGRLYISPEPRLDVDVLGHLMLIHVGIFAFLVQRGINLGAVSFWPTKNEWLQGLFYFAIAIIPLVTVGWLVHFATFAPKKSPPLVWIGLATGYFFGILWVVAFSEDIFRSVITRGLLSAKQSVTAAVLGSGLLFGCAHLWYRDFPNWGFAADAAIGHCFYTLAYLRGGSVRASMVTHALVVTTWRMLFRS